jgi:hypothetical protein
MLGCQVILAQWLSGILLEIDAKIRETKDLGGQVAKLF